MTPTIFSNADGSITVEYTIAVCGTYKVHVRGGKKGTHVIGSPFTLAVKAAPPSSGQCSAEGAGLSRARAGEPSTFVLHRKDSTGRLIPKGTSRFVLAFAYGEHSRNSSEGAKGLADGAFTHKVVDKGDGTFVVQYSTQRAGTYRLHVTLGLASPVEIHGSPFTLKIEPGPISAAQCELTTPLLTPLTPYTKADAIGEGGATTARVETPTIVVLTPVAELPPQSISDDSQSSCDGGCIGGVAGGCFVLVLVCTGWLSGAFAKIGCPPPCKKRAIAPT